MPKLFLMSSSVNLTDKSFFIASYLLIIFLLFFGGNHDLMFSLISDAYLTYVYICGPKNFGLPRIMRYFKAIKHLKQ